MSLPGLKNKIILLTGHRSGIGQATFKLLTELETKVVGWDLPNIDLRRIEKFPTEIKKIIDMYGRIDVLINNAGYTNIGNVEETSVKDFDEVMGINFKSPFFLCQAVIPWMVKQKKGVIINNASDQAFIAKRYSAVYGASKAAIAQFTKNIALDYGAVGIRANAIAPGSTDTSMLRTVISELSEKYPEIYPKNAEDFYKSSIPLKRFADPQEIAWLIAFLASDASSFIHGTTISIDGGFTAQ